MVVAAPSELYEAPAIVDFARFAVYLTVSAASYAVPCTAIAAGEALPNRSHTAFVPSGRNDVDEFVGVAVTVLLETRDDFIEAVALTTRKGKTFNGGLLNVVE
ncbi:MAG: hypothetical protein AAF599_11000 [Bacteroidota bacterium]